MRALFLIIMLFCWLTSQAQSSYSRVKIYAADHQLSTLENIGIPTDHGKRKRNTWLITDLSNQQIESLSNHDFQFDILIEDVQAYYINRSQQPAPESDRNSCGSAPGYTPIIPNNFQLGTYAGFYTYQEFLDELDSMASKYPQLITSRASIDTFLTHEGRPIYWVKISDNPNVNEAEPEVLYTAIHHAREPASLSELIFYMWYLLENHTDPEISAIINHTELYFVPMLNPDGYLENEVNFPNGGGLHRKNKRNIGSTNPGVDLNRNYDYQWNVSGTSSNVNNDTYPGLNAFSEPETQAIQFFCRNHQFQFALNAHSFGNLLLFPFGYANGVFTADHQYFQTFSNHQVMFNNYNPIKGSDLYQASGGSDDWMYDGDLTNKPKIYALTPEVGNNNDGFWPTQDRILPICQENVWPNLIAAHLPGVYGVTADESPNQILSSNGHFKYSYQRLGLSNGPVNISIQPVQNILSVGGSQTHTVSLMDIENDSISFTLPNNLIFGDQIIYILDTDFGQWSRRDTIVKTFGTGIMAFSDNANSLSNWSGTWGLTNSYFVTPNTSITDSPGLNYGNNQVNEIILDESFDFSQSTYAKAMFYARWEIENNFDYVQFMVSSDNGDNWIPQCGLYTNPGTSDQDEDQPLYDDFQTDWVLEDIDLSVFLGMSDLKFKFRLVSDNFETEDGFAFDDFKIITDGPSLSNNSVISPQFNLYPNPANGYLIIENADHIAQIQIYNQLGQLILTPSINNNSINTTSLPEGFYMVEMTSDQGSTYTQRIVISR